MTPQTLETIGTVVGILALTLSLITLAIQVRQQTQTLRAQTYGDALSRLAEMQSRLGGDSVLANLFAKGVRDPASLKPEERIQFAWIFYEMFGAFEFIYDQAKVGALSTEVWNRWDATLAWWISLPGIAAIWRAKPTPFSPSFSELVEEHLSNPKSDRASTMRYQMFVAFPSISEAAKNQRSLSKATG